MFEMTLKGFCNSSKVSLSCRYFRLTRISVHCREIATEPCQDVGAILLSNEMVLRINTQREACLLCPRHRFMEPRVRLISKGLPYDIFVPMSCPIWLAQVFEARLATIEVKKRIGHIGFLLSDLLQLFVWILTVSPIWNTGTPIHEDRTKLRWLTNLPRHWPVSFLSIWRPFSWPLSSWRA